MDFHACRQVRLNALLQFFQIFTELQIVAAALHGQGNADGRFAIVKHLGIRRLGISPFYRRNIAEAEYTAIGIDRQIADGFHIFKDAGQAEVHIVRFRIHHAGGRHGVLSLDGIGNSRRRNAQFSQLGIGHFDVNLFRLFSYEFHLADVIDRHHHAADLFSLLAQFLIGIAVASDGIDRPVDIVEAVIVIGTIHTIGQVFFHIFRQVTHFMPGTADTVPWRLIVEVHVNNRLTGTGITFDIVEVGRILQFLFDFIGYLFLHLLCRRAGPGYGNNHGPHRISRIFHAAQFHVGENAGNGDEDDKVPDEDPVLDRDFR